MNYYEAFNSIGLICIVSVAVLVVAFFKTFF
jgi:hypothetical protein